MGMESSSDIKDVIVVGGGFAGMSATKELRRSGHRVCLLEATGALGGRVKQVELQPGFGFVDAGAEFIHGQQTLAFELAQKHGWEVNKVFDPSDPEIGKRNYFYFRGKLISAAEAHKVQDLKSALDLYALAMCDSTKQRLQNCGVKCSVAAGMEHVSLKDESLQEWMTRNYKVDCNMLNIVDAIHCQSEGEDVNNFSILDSGENEDRFECGESHFRFSGTYKDLLDFYKEEFDMIAKLNWRVMKIDWQDENFIRVFSDNNEMLQAKKVVITVSLGVLRACGIVFRPELPHWKVEAISSMSMRRAVKLICVFTESFGLAKNSVVFCDSGLFRQFWTYEVTGNHGTFFTVSALATASLADQISQLPGAHVKDTFLAQLDAILGHGSSDDHAASRRFYDFILYDWGKDVNFRGGYSCPTLGSFGCSDRLGLPIDNRLFFAGEATNRKGRATVQAAIESGVRVAQEIRSQQEEL